MAGRVESLDTPHDTNSMDSIPDSNAVRNVARQKRDLYYSEKSSRALNIDILENPFTSSNPLLDPRSPDFSAQCYARCLMQLYRADPERYPESKLGVAFQNLSAYGYNQENNYQLTAGNLLLWLSERAYGILTGNSGTEVEILKPMDGCINPGEMCVVLGRPGAGCSTFLRTIASQTHGFNIGTESTIDYGGLHAKDIRSKYRGEVTYCAENELHFPTLTVGETLEFAARMRTPRNSVPGLSRHEYAIFMRDVIMAMYGLSHTVNTKVGDDIIHGVSGGERKRVSIAELALSGASLQCWDNSTRGLDSATALEFIRTLRLQGETFNTTSLVAVYQASEEMFSLFDKVIVLYDGYQIYFGPISHARQYFFDMGWEPKPRQSIPDFLTSLSQPAERRARKGWEDLVPLTAAQFNEKWHQSELHKLSLSEIHDFSKNFNRDSLALKKFEEVYQSAKSRWMPDKLPYMISFQEQIAALCQRGWRRILGAPENALTYVMGQVVMSFVIASIFYNMPEATSSFYHRTSIVFFALLFNAMFAEAEIFTVFETRNIVAKHYSYAFYHPTVDAIASLIMDMPQRVVACILSNTALYFLSNLRREPGNYFFFLLIMFWSILVMSHLFRTLAACTNTIPESMVPANIVILCMTLFIGFVVPVTRMHGWCRWINYLNPLAYSYEALMSNEFHDREFTCSKFYPYSPDQGATGKGYVCSAAGSMPGDTTVSGDRYLATQYEYYFAHQWRNLGIIIGFSFFFLATYLLAIYLNPGEQTTGEVLVFPRKILRRIIKNRNSVLEDVKENEGAVAMSDSDYEMHQQDIARCLLDASNDIFYWKDVCYDIKIKGKPRRILSYVDGWVKPGTTTALMGATGAGKTTLLDTLASRVTMGVVHGQILINGLPRGEGFQRTTGYAMQQDLHLDTSTVREALVFSAVLRQPYSTPYKEKIKYVDNVLEVLEMNAYADAVIGTPGTGLNVEQRKRLTIGVELAAKPKLLLFLDEPTSGLDSQTAWSVCQLIKKLSNAGQAILCTIHQPSALLLEQFDRLLFLAAGGKTVYFGNIGSNCHDLITYFESNGSQPCPPDANPAEWILEVVGAAPGSHALRDWPNVWLHSPERQAVRQEIDTMMQKHAENRQLTADGVNHDATQQEFAAPFWLQFVMVLRRVLQQYWRTPSYIWAKAFLNIFSALFNGFVFFKADTSLQGLQNLMFSIFVFTLALTAIVQQYLPVFEEARNLYEARERPSKILSWKFFLLAMLSAELPWQILLGTLSFLCWYYPAGLYREAQYDGQVSERGAITFLYVVLFFIFSTSLAQICIAPLRDAHTATSISTLLFTFTLIFAGVLATPQDFPGFWIFMYRVSPNTYWIGGMMSAGVANAPVRCEDREIVLVYPPQQQSCNDYFKEFFNNGGTGYIREEADGACGYCAASETNVFLESYNIKYSDRWRNFGILWAYVGFNILASLVLYYLARVPKSKSRVVKPTDKESAVKDAALEESNAAEH